MSDFNVSLIGKISFDSCGVILTIVCLVYCYIQRSVKSRRRRIYIILAILTLISASAATTTGIMGKFVLTGKIVYVQYLCHYLYFFSHNMTALCMAAYVMENNGILGRMNWFQYIIMGIPCFIAEVIILLNPLFHKVYYLDEYNVYVRGPWMPFIYLLSAVYFLLAIISALFYTDEASRIYPVSLYVMLGIAGAGILIQMLVPELLLEMFAQSLVLIGSFLLIEDEKPYLDPMTGSLRRSVFLNNTKRLLNYKEEFYVIQIHLNNIQIFHRLLPSDEVTNLYYSIGDYLKRYVSSSNLFTYDYEQLLVLLEHTTETEANELTERMIARFKEPWKLSGNDFNINVYASYFGSPEDANDLDTIVDLLESIDVNANEARRQGRINKAKSRPEIERTIQNALTNEQFEVYYQPIWSAQEDKIIAAEALVRMRDDKGEFVSPELFIPIAERNGLISEIGEYVYETTCKFLSELQYLNIGLKYIEINLSYYQFLNYNFINRLEEIRRQYKVPVDMINLEVTESEVEYADDRMLRESLERMRGLGYTFSLDDFGTGFSNIDRLLSKNYKNIKIDRSILLKSEESKQAEHMLAAMISSIRRMGMHIIQEGVETEEQKKKIVSYGGDMIQGYYFSQPINKDEFLEYVKGYNLTA